MALVSGVVIAGWLGSPRADELPVTHLSIVGGLANVSQFTNHEAPFWTRHIAEASHGRVTADITPFDALGLRGPELLWQLRLGAIEFGTTSLSLNASEHPEAAAIDLAGLNPTIASLRKNADSYRPVLAELYRERYGIELLALWSYPAQVLFCKAPIQGLRDLAGRKVRTASIVHSDFVEALGGIGIALPFAGTVDALRKNVVDCAITGALSGNYVHLDRETTHLYAMTLSWGPVIFVANATAWRRLDPAVQAFIKRELKTFEDEMWTAAERETAEGFACNTGQGACPSGNPGRMILVPVRAADEALRLQILREVIVPRWAERCGQDCLATWERTVGANLPPHAASD